MAFQFEATYEDGVLKLDQPLPFPEHERLIVSVKPKVSRARQSYGLIGWQGDPEVLRRIAQDPDFGVLESP